MNIKRNATLASLSLFAAMIVIAGSAVMAAGQAIPPAKIATIDVDEFSNPKSGITRLVAVMAALETEMKPRRDEIAQQIAKYDKLGKEINDTKAIADPKTIAAKNDEAEKLRVEIEHKQREGQVLLDRRMKEVTDPIYEDLMRSLDAYAKKRSIDMVLDLSKIGGSVMLVNNALDITASFIAEYNSKPATP